MGEKLQRIKNVFSSSSKEKEDVTDSDYVKQTIYNLKNVSPKSHQFLKDQSESQSENMRKIAVNVLEWFVEEEINSVKQFKKVLKSTRDESQANNLTEAIDFIVKRYMQAIGYQPKEEGEEESKGEQEVENAIYEAVADEIESGEINLNNLQLKSLDVGPLSLGTPEKKANPEEQLIKSLMESNTPLSQKIDNYTKLKKEAGARPSPSSLFKDVLTRAIDQGQLDVGSIIENFMTPKTQEPSSSEEQSKEEGSMDIEFNIEDNRTENKDNEEESEGGGENEGD